MTTAELPRVPWHVPDWHNDGAACRLFPELDRPEVLDPDEFVEYAPGIREHKVVSKAFNAWHNAKPGSPEEHAAKLICAACPVRFDCALGALERGEPHGIWGGLDRNDRTEIAKKHGFPKPAVLPDHGTNARRVKHGCDCGPCKKAHALYEQMRREKHARRRAELQTWGKPLLVLTVPYKAGGRIARPGQLLLPLDVPAVRGAEREPQTDEAASPAAA